MLQMQYLSVGPGICFALGGERGVITFRVDPAQSPSLMMIKDFQPIQPKFLAQEFVFDLTR
jgi:hypothetical protein